jgi:cell division protein FtsA
MQQRPESGRPVDERELEALLERTLRLAVNRLVSELPEDQDWLLIDAAPVVLTVDGRGVTDPIGFRGRELGAAVFATITRVGTVRTWGAVAKDLEFSSVTLTATPLALAAGLPVAHGILVDIGGAATDLVWCSAGRPVIIATLPIGGFALTSALQQKWGLTARKAERLKRAYSSRKLSADAETQVQGVLWPTLLRWLEDTEAAMSRLSHDEPLPQHLYVLGGGSALPEMVEAVRSLAWSQQLRFERYPEVSCLRPTDVPRVSNQTGRGRQLGDVSALALASWVAEQHRSDDRPARILSELCQV